MNDQNDQLTAIITLLSFVFVTAIPILVVAEPNRSFLVDCRVRSIATVHLMPHTSFLVTHELERDDPTFRPCNDFIRLSEIHCVTSDLSVCEAFVNRFLDICGHD